MNSKNKGKVGELEWAHYLTHEGFPAHRGQQFKGTEDSPDVECPSLPTYHFEVKRVQRLDLHGAVVQAISDAGTRTPVVAHRRNQGQWLVTMLASDWIKLIRESL